ncbi:hypothetical protein ACE193_07665 [Bernardetia sp. OM2101]|uniref:hypothetical protein n=1 Tax=Bernardetia sp. OM2101 TaxID=3344876 RepID=UPI0035CECE7D
MKRLFYLCSALLLCLGIMFYKQTPTYNPFDDVFDIDTNQLVECDTIIGSCGYINFQPKTKKRLKVYYQIYAEDINDVVAKGFCYEEDTFLIPSHCNHQILSDSLDNLPIDIKEFNHAIEKFDYVYLDKIMEKNIDTYSPKIRISHKNNLDTVRTSLYWHVSEEDSTKAIRTISYFKSKPRIFRNANGGFIE